MKRVFLIAAMAVLSSVIHAEDAGIQKLTLTIVPGSGSVGEQFDFATTVEKRHYTEVVEVASDEVEAAKSLLLQHENVRHVSETTPVSNPEPQNMIVPLSKAAFTNNPLFNDPGFVDQYAWVEGEEKTSLEGTPEGSSVQKAVKASETAEKLTIAVVDGGFHDVPSFQWKDGYNLVHPDNDPAGLLPFGETFINSNEPGCGNNHGQRVASVIGGKQDDNLGNAGVIQNGVDADFYAVRALNCNGSGFSTTVAEAIRYAAGDPNLVNPVNGDPVPRIDQPADIINLSLGQSTETPCAQYQQDAIDYARSQGAVVVFAAGNTGRNQSLPPGNCDGVINVGATDQRGRPALFSTYGPDLSYSAGGTNIPVMDEEGLAFASGTSFSAPLVSGILANLWKDVPGLTANQLRQFSLQATNDTPMLDQDMGNGVLDAVKLQEKAIEAVAPPDIQVKHPLGDDCVGAEKLAFFSEQDSSACDMREVTLNTDLEAGQHIVVFETDGNYTTTAPGASVHQTSQSDIFLVDEWDQAKDYGVQICDSPDGTQCASNIIEPLNLNSMDLACSR
mgnify:CR=1 FL=1